MVIEFFTANINELFTYLFDANKRIFHLYLLGAIVLAVPVYIKQITHELPENKKSLLGFLRFLTPWKIYSAASARHDYLLLFINKLIKAAIFPLIIFAMAPIAIGFSNILEWIFGVIEPIAISATAIVFIFTLLLFIFDDFTRFYLHYSLHKYAILWEFHKVHHSATVLTPFTIYRSHPIENLLYAFRMTLTQGVVVGLCYYLFGPTLKMVDILGANLFIFLFNIFGSNLRHSHIRFSWGDKLEKWLISPAQHQIHHGELPSQHHSNFGTCLAIWDRMWGFLQLSSQVGKLTYGIKGVKHSSMMQIYLEPFKRVGYRLLGMKDKLSKPSQATK